MKNNENTLSLTILLFGACREIAGTDEIVDATLPESSNIIDAGYVWHWLINKYPALKSYERSVLVAVNENHVKMNHPLKGGDTVAFFPPVSGG